MIKRFESFKSPTYFEIDEVEAEKLVSSTRRILNQYVKGHEDDNQKFTKDEIKRIKSLTPKNCSMGEFGTNINFVPRYDSIVSEIIIWKCLDEWYVIEIVFHTDSGAVTCWKCDQLDGLTDFLKTRHLKNILEV